MTKRLLYIETSIVSYLTARLSNDLMVAAWQGATIEWWETQKDKFDLFTSQVTLEEAANRRLEALRGIPVLVITEAVKNLSKALMQNGALPARALDDSLHIAIAAVHGIDYFLTWNCRHINNAETKPLIRNVCANNRYSCPEICSPLELMGVDEND